MAFELPALPYAHDALEPHIDARTMEIHHGKHHNGYTTKLNAAIEGTELAGKSIEEILGGLDMNNNAVRNNGGGYYNHCLFWEVMGPNGGAPAGDLLNVINDIRESSGHPFWLWLGLVVRSCRRQAGDLLFGEPRQSLNARYWLWGHTRSWFGRVGACVLPELPEPPSRLRICILERGQLGRCSRALQRWQIRSISKLIAKGGVEAPPFFVPLPLLHKWVVFAYSSLSCCLVLLRTLLRGLFSETRYLMSWPKWNGKHHLL